MAVALLHVKAPPAPKTVLFSCDGDQFGFEDCPCCTDVGVHTLQRDSQSFDWCLVHVQWPPMLCATPCIVSHLCQAVCNAAGHTSCGTPQWVELHALWWPPRGSVAAWCRLRGAGLRCHSAPHLCCQLRPGRSCVSFTSSANVRAELLVGG